MNQVIQFFRQNPWLLLLGFVWIAGAVGNIAKAIKKARERKDAATRPTPMPGREKEPEAQPENARAVRDAREEKLRRRAEAAREMRRMLGVDDEAASAPRPPSEQAQRPASPPPLRPRRIQSAAEPERASVPVVPTTGARKLALHADPHVGEGIQSRSLGSGSRIGAADKGPGLGNLGGRVHKVVRRRQGASRYALTDLKRAIVLNEILGPPLALRSGERTY